MALQGRGWPVAGDTAASHFDGLDIERHVIDRTRPTEDGDVPDADVVVASWWETAEWVAALSARKGTKVYFIQQSPSDDPHARG